MAILVQRTRRENVKKALETGDYSLVGFYERKKKAIEALRNHREEIPKRLHEGVEVARKKLMSLPGIGRETADVILLHAFKARTFPADEYARRFFNIRGYERLRKFVLEHFEGSVEELEEFRALIVEYAKRYLPTKRRSSGSMSRGSRER